MIPVDAPEVGGVTLKRHILDREAHSLARLARKFGERCRRWLADTPENQIPGEDVRHTFSLYSQAVTALLREQRERAKLPPPSIPVLSDAEFEAQVQKLVRSTVLKMTRAELEQLLAERTDKGGSDD